jgi:uroporphyrinogen decarboxylase
MEFLREGVRLCVEASPVPLIGFCGSPWTVALYLVQGAHEPGFVEARRFLREAPGRFEAILDRLSAASVEWLAAQAEAGAAALQIFDSWGGLLGPADYVRWALPPLVRLVRETRKLFPTIPLILFSKGTGAYLDRILTACPVEAVNPDWSVDLAALRRSPECPRAVQGNLDPALFFAPRAEIRRVVREHIARVGPTGLVLNTGHGLAPTVDPDSVRVAVEAAHEIGGGA